MSFETSFFGIECEQAYGQIVYSESFGGLSTLSEAGEIRTSGINDSLTAPDDCPLRSRDRASLDSSLK